MNRPSEKAAASSGVRRLVVDPDTHPLAAGTTYTIEVVNGTVEPLGISNHDIIEVKYSSSLPQEGDF